MKIIIIIAVTSLIIECTGSRRVKRGWFAGTRPPGAECAFNPCTVDNFCGVGRTCDMDNSCIHHCKCDEGSTHESCLASDNLKKVTSSVIASSRPPLKCAFDMCKHAFTCSGNRECVLDSFCHPYCVCKEGSSHELCTNFTTDSTQETRTDGGAGCSLSCVNGVCIRKDSHLLCECKYGWTGQFCEEELCPLTCKEGFSCAKSLNNSYYCRSSTSHTLISSTASMSPEDDVKNFSDVIVNACSSDYYPRNAICANGLPCKYGYCEVDDAGIWGCRCHKGGRGPLCSWLCCLECGKHGECMLDPKSQEVCNCHVKYTGANCTELKPEETPLVQLLQPTWYLWVVGGSVFVLVLLLVCLVLVPYLLWRHRVILIMKIVHYFQAYEDDDERQWDAFVSYRANDEDEAFVVHTLLPELEKRRGFTLNVHFRDFVPGDAIANNIICAVQGSRRTILIITPDFVQSEFTRYEYEKAREEMLTRKHRIIPILLKDISQVRGHLDQTLKDILSSVTYLEWPQCGSQKKIDKFWKRLELSLPKKKHLKHDQIELNQNNIDPYDVAVEFDQENQQNVYCTIPHDNNSLNTISEYDTIKDVNIT